MCHHKQFLANNTHFRGNMPHKNHKEVFGVRSVVRMRATPSPINIAFGAVSWFRRWLRARIGETGLITERYNAE
jgi:hypothetical protein